jgi:hypothetical protein
MFVEAFAIPCCTLPFCLAASGCYLLQVMHRTRVHTGDCR